MMTPAERLVIASRGSPLALRQAEIVAKLVQRVAPGTDVKVVPVTTTGDGDKQRPFAALGAKGVFTTEVEREVVAGRADVAVHSAKDLTASIAEGCSIVCIPSRARVEDVVVGGSGPTGEQRLASLQTGAAVGTSSMRRRVLLMEARPDLRAVEFRGNLDTRLRKVAEGAVAAAVLAAAGIDRLRGADPDAGAALEASWWVPAPAQGALAVEALSERPDLAELFAPVTDRAAAAEVACERAFSARLEGGCSVPLGCLARATGSALVATGFLGSPDGGTALRDRISGPVGQAESLGVKLAEAMLHSGADEILQDISATRAPSPSPP
jgi:hydroxymethylbilane synthase